MAPKKIVEIAPVKGAPTKKPAKKKGGESSPRPKRGELRRRVAIGLGGILFLIYAIDQFKELEEPAPITRAGANNPNGEASQAFALPGDGQIWDNPEQTMLERNFCLGNQNAASCSRRPRHPFSEEFGNAGWSEEDYIEYLGWHNTPSPERDNKVIGDTFVYTNKGFKFFGK